MPFDGSVTPKAEAPAKQDDAPPPKEPSERLAETLRATRVKFLGELKTEAPEEASLYRDLQEELLREHPRHEPLLLERLRRLDGDKRKDKLKV